MKHRNLTYLALLFILISAVSVYSRTNSCLDNIPAKEHESVLSQNTVLGDIITTTELGRSGKYFQGNVFEYSIPQINLQKPEQDLLIKQDLIIRENQKRTILRFLSYLKN